ncbi:uncharacterized protein DEA37_0002233 [Paragonimus westermani]|uniref:NAD dependent epimerase/dehydratase n=1 Tax=Paragonimus westermani TaxID=34504 RepID=A0A5J4NKW7_9TREM|nr:uncharacterized protein DEA37_0002233 [Paragonimus westermani]
MTLSNRYSKNTVYNNIQVLVVGVDKTGTSYLKALLEKLYSKPCFHFNDLFTSSNQQLDEWIRLPDLEDDKIKLKERLSVLLKDYQFASGFPVAAYLEDLLDLYPNAKIILTVRDPETWLATFRSTTTPRDLNNSNQSILKSLFELPGSKKLNKLYRMTLRQVLGQTIDLQNDTQLMNAYVSWNEFVNRVVPKDRLLVYNMKQGWKPLCDFLQIPVPSTPFPSVRRRTSLVKWDKAKVNNWTHWIVCCSLYTLFGIIAFHLIK